MIERGWLTEGPQAATRYVPNLSDVRGVRWLQVQTGSNHVPFRFALVSELREQLAVALEQAGVQTRSFF